MKWNKSATQAGSSASGLRNGVAQGGGLEGMARGKLHLGRPGRHPLLPSALRRQRSFIKLSLQPRALAVAACQVAAPASKSR